MLITIGYCDILFTPNLLILLSLLESQKTKVQNNMSEEKKKPDYSADSIQALEGMEHVRMRPSMYIGDVGVRGLHHLVYEVVDNSIDEAMGGYCDTIYVTMLDGEGIRVRDNGRGIPIGMHKKEGVSALEVVPAAFPETRPACIGATLDSDNQRCW